MSQRGKLTTANFVVRSVVDGEVVETPILEARGGGVAAVAGFLLRTVVLLLRKDVRPVMFLDETFAQLSADYEPAMADVLRELVDKTQLQIILVTHSTAYDDVADKSYRVSLDQKGKTKIESLDGGS
jgi:ABC-type thiamine transport system ATPase subunit